MQKTTKRVKILAMRDYQIFMAPDEMNQQIAQRMRERRKEKHLTQATLSKRADVSLGSLKRFEQTGEISLSSLIKIAFALGCEDDFHHLFAKKGYSSIQEVIDEQL